MSNVLTSIEQCVESLYKECWYTDADHPDPMTEVVDVVGASKRFHTERLEARRNEIIDLLYRLPVQSRKSNGTGLLCTHTHLDRYGLQWTTSTAAMINLFVLGAAIKKLTFYLPLGKTSVSACTLDTVVIVVDDED